MCNTVGWPRAHIRLSAFLPKFSSPPEICLAFMAHLDNRSRPGQYDNALPTGPASFEVSESVIAGMAALTQSSSIL